MTADHGRGQGSAGFDELLRWRRRAVGLTQSDLAQRAGVGVRTVRDLERGRSTRPQRTTVELLATALGLAGGDRVDFLAAARGPGGAGAAGAGAAEPPAPSLALPAPSPLIGRDRDVAEVTELLVGADGPAPPVVSLVGLAGVGKTGIALAVAARAARHHPAGVGGIVITEGSSEDGDVLSAVATVFGVARPADLPARLGHGPAMLLVDAIERQPGSVAAALHWLTGRAPTLRVLTTGRHPVGLPGERVWPVSSLEVPPPDVPADLASISRYPAAALFLDRLRQVRREPPEPAELGALVGLVRRLGGLPLALELAAARGRILDLNEMLDRYGDRVLDLSVTPVTRQAVAVTLRDAVAASYRLLEPHERCALRRLSAFRNRWSVELAEAMLHGGTDPAGTEPPTDPVPLLDRLLALGLLSARSTGTFRFRLLDVVRDFAVERAAAEGELTLIRRRHAVVFARMAARLAPDLAGGSFGRTVRLLDEVTGDLWVALAHAANDDPHTALTLAAQLPRWWRFRGRDVAGRQWLRRLLDDPRTADAAPAVRAWAQVGLAQLAQEHGAGPQELPAARQALEAVREADDVPGELAARSVLCGLLTAVGAHDEARLHGEAALALAGRTGRVRDMAVAQNNLTWHEIRVGDLRAARRRLAAVDRLAAQCGEDRLRVLARANLAEVARLGGRYADAVEQGRRVAAALTDLGDPGHQRRVLGTVGMALAQAGQLAEAEAVLVDLRDGNGPKGRPELRRDGESTVVPAEDGVTALIEGYLALRRGDREWAAEWFGTAARASVDCRDQRDVVESLVGLLASTDDPEGRRHVRLRLDEVRRQGGISLLPGELALLGAGGAGVPTS